MQGTAQFLLGNFLKAFFFSEDKICKGASNCREWSDCIWRRRESNKKIYIYYKKAYSSMIAITELQYLECQ